MNKKYLDDLTYQIIGAAIEDGQQTFVNEYFRLLPD